jgi:hypothetical protein
MIMIKDAHSWSAGIDTRSGRLDWEIESGIVERVLVGNRFSGLGQHASRFVTRADEAVFPVVVILIEDRVLGIGDTPQDVFCINARLDLITWLPADMADKLIVATQTYETTDATVDSQIVALRASGANVMVTGGLAKVQAGKAGSHDCDVDFVCRRAAAAGSF